MAELFSHSGAKVGFVVALLVGVYIVRRMLAAPKADPHHADVQCVSCGWAGSVSKYKPRCPKCGQPISLGH